MTRIRSHRLRGKTVKIKSLLVMNFNIVVVLVVQANVCCANRMGFYGSFFFVLVSVVIALL